MTKEALRSRIQSGSANDSQLTFELVEAAVIDEAARLDKELEESRAKQKELGSVNQKAIREKGRS
jgi:hypothetical protein